MKSVFDWLLEKNQPSVRYRTLVELLDRPITDNEVRRTESLIPRKGWAAQILREQLPGFRVGNTRAFRGYWHNYVLLSRPKYIATFWKFLVLTDLAVTSKNKKMMDTCELVSESYLKSKKSYHLCTTANAVRGLLLAKYNDDQPRIKAALNWLVDQQKDDGGWHCFESPDGTIDCWQPLSAFAALPKERRSKSIQKSIERGSEFYLRKKLYRESKRYPPYFRFHYPVHYYYDLLVGLEVLSSLGFADDPRMKFALDLLKKKMKKPSGRWNLDALHPDIPKWFPATSYSTVPPYEPFPMVPFALEKVAEPSKMVTLRALKVLKQVEGKI